MMATLQSGKALLSQLFMERAADLTGRNGSIPTNKVADQTQHQISCLHTICNEIQLKVNLEINPFRFYLHFPYCPNFV